MHIEHKLQLTPLVTVQHTNKIQGSAVEDFIQLTACNLCNDKDKIKWKPIAGYQYTACACESDIHKTVIMAYQYRICQ